MKEHSLLRVKKMLCCIYYLCIYFIKSFFSSQNEDGTKTEYRVWNPFRYKLAASILGGVDDVWIESFIHEIAPGSSGRKQGLPNPFPSNIEKNCLGGWILNRS
jgi:hypothetical protein